ncbi:MAG: hypothetical protein EON48_02500 [Acetobacteraceae bacterium]|nr:MAG: hypothetical protein EON48_02500 [Acetobacteraceae bacterium]
MLHERNGLQTPGQGHRSTLKQLRKMLFILVRTGRQSVWPRTSYNAEGCLDMADRPLSINIRRPLILKSNDLVLLTREDGGIPGFGLFYRDTCYLDTYTLRLHGTEPMRLSASDSNGMVARIGLSNLRLRTSNGEEIPDHRISVGRTLLLPPDGTSFTDTLVFRNAGTADVTLPVTLDLATTFESMFALRGAPPGWRGRLHPPEWDGASLRFAYEGADGLRRTLLLAFSVPVLVAPCTAERTTVHVSLVLPPGEERALTAILQVDERPFGKEPPPAAPALPGPGEVQAAREASAAALTRGYARLESPSDGLAGVVARSLADLALLEVRREGHRFTAAGVPWFVGLFGRDSLLPTIQCLPFNPDLGARTTRVLAHWQGTRNDPYTREEPGKILHELRVGEMARLGEVPQTPSYAAVDATLIFLVAIAATATGPAASTCCARCGRTSTTPWLGSTAMRRPPRAATSSTTAPRRAASRRTRAGAIPDTGCCAPTAPTPSRRSHSWKCRATPIRHAA